MTFPGPTFAAANSCAHSESNLDVALGPAAPASPVEQTIKDAGPGRRTGKILIVDDEAVNVRVTRKYLEQDGYHDFITTTDATKAIELMESARPDIVLLDIVMPKITGLDILLKAREIEEIGNIPIVILTAASDPETKLTALRRGATDFLAKPVDPSELIARVRNVLVVKAHQDHLSAHAQELKKAVKMRTFELEMSRKHLIECLARAAEYRDDDTGKHIVRVGRYAAIIAQELGFNDQYVCDIEQAAQLHDVGKIAIPDDILKNTGTLDPQDYELMMQHCVYGLKIIRPMSQHQLRILRSHPELGARILNINSGPIIQMAARIALTHHERWDGMGYPIGLAGEDIPIEGRITAVADVYDALSSIRPYKPAFPREKCFETMRRQSGKQFDPRVLNAFFKCSNDIVRIQMEDVDCRESH